MTLTEISERAGRAEVNIAPLLIIIGMAFANSHDTLTADSAMELLFCPVEDL
jgi:hypothetical protein